MDKLNYFCTHIRAALACYMDMTPEQKTRAALYASRKLRNLDALRTAANSPGGKLAAELWQKTQQLNTSQKDRT